MLPDMALVANGMALAMKMRREPRVAMTFFGEGSTANGQWHEAMNFAGIHRLPVVFVLENNRLRLLDAERARVRGRPGRARRRPTGSPASTVDGNDVEAVFEAVPRGGRAGARGRRADADRVPDDAHARPRRARRHELRARRSCCEEWARARPDRALRASGSCSRHGFEAGEVEEIASRSPRLRRRVRRSARSRRRCPTPRSALEGVFADAFEPLGDGERVRGPSLGARRARRRA